MATVAELPGSSGEGFGSDIAGMGNFLIDPAGAARRVHSKWFWIGPLIVFSLVSIVAGYLMMPITRHVMEVAPLPQGVSPEQYQKNMELGLTIQRIALYFAPIMVAFIFAFQTRPGFGSRR